MLLVSNSVLRSADCHCGLQDPSCCSACAALPGALHPAASAHYGLSEGTPRGWDSNSYLFESYGSTVAVLAVSLNLALSKTKGHAKETFIFVCQNVFRVQFFSFFFSF